MQRKLKSVFHRSSKSRDLSDQESSTHHEANSPRSDRRRVSSDQHGLTSGDSSVNGSPGYNGRSRPVSSVYEDQRHSQQAAKDPAATEFSSSTDPNGGAIANDYKAYLPALSPVNDDHDEEYVPLDDERRHDAGKNGGRYEEVMADRNAARYEASIDGGNRGPAVPPHRELIGVATSIPATDPTPIKQHLHQQSTGARSVDPTLSSASNGGSMGNYTVGSGVPTNGGVFDGIRPHAKTGSRDVGLSNQTDFPLKTAREESVREMSKPHEAQGTQSSGIRHATINGKADGEETDLARKLREDGVVDLRNTTDTDGEIQWAPAVTHEMIKPHQHEIIQQKIYREIHNYEHFHRIQPVMMTEVLPPRHWIPNPKGEGLIEISADELPARTGKNRWWSICEHSSPYALQKTSHKYRTEPEIIEAGTFMTEEGFERKETIIIHPPTLADLTGYGGPVQAVHFDHKTGERWMGELTTMDKLHELQQSLDRAPDARAFQMDGLNKALPNVPEHSIPPRKPVSGYSSAVHSSNVGRKLSAV